VPQPDDRLSDAAPSDDAVRSESAGGQVRRALGTALDVASWFYLSVIAFLLGWVALVSVLMGWSPNLVSSGSMQPAISAGDVVMTAAPEPDVVFDEGTVVTFEDPLRDGGLVTHRVVSLNDDGTYRTRGDGNPASDSSDLDPDDVVGVGRLLIPAVGLPIVWLERGQLVMFGAWVVVTVLAARSAFDIGPRRKRSGDDHDSI
jgi:signal peptidase I